MEIAKTLYSIPPSQHVNKFTLIDAMKDYLAKNNIGYLDLEENLENLGKKGYIVRERSEPNYFLTPAVAKAIEIVNVFEEKIVKPAIEISKRDPRFRHRDDLNQLVTAAIYEAIR